MSKKARPLATYIHAPIATAIILGACAEPTSVVVEPLRVIAWAPITGSVCVDHNAVIRAVFSHNLDESALTESSFFLIDSAEAAVAADISYDPSNFLVTLTPQSSLAYDTVHTAVATPGLSGDQVGQLPAEVRVSFITVPRYGCAPDTECLLPSDCPAPQICSRIGTCIDECVDDLDCPGDGTCEGGACSSTKPDGGPPGGDATPGDAEGG